MSNLDSARTSREAAEAALNTASPENRANLEASAMAARNAEATAAAEQRAAQERATQEKTYKEKAAADKSSQEKAKAEKVATEKAAKLKAKQAKWGTYSERTIVKGVALWGNRRTVTTHHKPTPKTDEARAANRASAAAKARAEQARAEARKTAQVEANRQKKVEQRQGMIDGMPGRKGVTPERVAAIQREMVAQERARQAAAMPQQPMPSPEKSAQLSQIDAERQAMREKINDGKTQQAQVSDQKAYAQKVLAERRAEQPKQGIAPQKNKQSRQHRQGMGGM